VKAIGADGGYRSLGRRVLWDRVARQMRAVPDGTTLVDLARSSDGG